jgi:polysaccharide export outer membrane protein
MTLSAQLRYLRRSALALLVLSAPAALFFVPQVCAQFNGPPTITVDLNRPTTLTTDPSILFPVTHDQILQPGDVLTVHVFAQNDYMPVVRVSNDGNVQLPLVGQVPVGGLSLSQAEVLIARRLEAAGMYVNPQVTIVETEGPNSVVTVIGETHGSIPVSGSRRLFDVLSAAGGLPPTASHVITIHRRGVAESIVVDLGSDPSRSDLANIPLFAGDTVVVARIGVVYILGEFRTPGSIPLTPFAPLTLTQATALSGGVNFAGKLSDLHLIRTVGDHRTVVSLDVDKIFRGKAPDPILQPNDILYLPSSVLKVAIQQGGIGAVLGAASLAFTAIAITR